MWDLFVESAWRVTVAGFVFGVGLPVLFAAGVRSSVLASGGGADAGVTSSVPTRVNRAIAILCFVLVLTMVGLGLLVIVASGFGKEVSFDHIYPTLVPIGLRSGMPVNGVNRQGLVSRVVGWLRAGYPDGVPAQDYVALLGILQRILTPTEVDRVVEELTRDADSGTAVLTRGVIEQRIENVLKAAPVPEDVTRVSGRLAAAGWPLGPATESSEDVPDGRADVRPGLVSRIVEWLREGYPSTMPAQDYIPLVALVAPPLDRR